MSLISGRVERKDMVEGWEFPALDFSKKEKENRAGTGTSANDLKQECRPSSGRLAGREEAH